MGRAHGRTVARALCYVARHGWHRAPRRYCAMPRFAVTHDKARGTRAPRRARSSVRSLARPPLAYNSAGLCDPPNYDYCSLVLYRYGASLHWQYLVRTAILISNSI
ncbi:unnamed protein product [Arctia plantaginis]|uniref:Uncharacterized protein n=1 Tax=Arctia plantaginis TaxID=874455 RepID=A0A8S0ZF21_ARCPL|nr:unnamed protein product [Arctia plantaginis]